MTTDALTALRGARNRQYQELAAWMTTNPVRREALALAACGCYAALTDIERDQLGFDPLTLLRYSHELDDDNF